MIPTQITTDPTVIRLEYILFGLYIGTVWYLCRVGVAHLTTNGFTTDGLAMQYQTVKKIKRTIYIGLVAGIIAAHTTPSHRDGALFLLVPVADELLRRLSKHRQAAYEEPETERSATEPTGPSATQAYVEGEIDLLEFEDRLEEEIELEDDW